jgi:hypothetical protein
MAQQEHVHIITAGEVIFPSYATTLRTQPDITHTFVFADTELYTNTVKDAGAVRAQKDTARDEVNKVKALAASLKIPASLVYVNPPADVSVRDSVLKIKKEHPGAKFTFDLSAGSKDMCLALFTLSLWVEGEACYAFSNHNTGAVSTNLAVPKAPVGDVAANPNYLKILRTLAATPVKPEQKPGTRVVPRSYIFNQLAGFYVPIRKKGVNVTENKTGKTDLFTGKRAVLHDLSQGTCSNILKVMVAAGLIEEGAGPEDNRKEKYYRITPSGELSLRLAELQPRKP